MSNQKVNLGEVIGKRKHTFSITNENKEKVTINVTFDYTNTSNADIMTWLNGNRTVAFQNSGLRAMSVEELEALDGSIVIAHHASRKIESREDRIKGYIDLGFPRTLAEKLVDNPELLDKVAEMV